MMKRRVRLQRQVISRQMRRTKGRCGFDIGARLCQCLPGQGVHQVEVDVIKMAQCQINGAPCRVRLALEKERTRSLRGGDIDIKYGSGGMLDIYFAMRYLQLRDNVPDVADRKGEEEKRRSGADENPRSTSTMLDKLEQHHREASSLPDSSTPLLPLSALRDGHTFLSALDHQLRLTIGRTTRLSIANQTALATIAERMGLGSPAELLEHLTAHRLAIREAFDAILPDVNR